MTLMSPKWSGMVSIAQGSRVRQGEMSVLSFCSCAGLQQHTQSSLATLLMHHPPQMVLIAIHQLQAIIQFHQENLNFLDLALNPLTQNQGE
jgi:hypothetical protein